MRRRKIIGQARLQIQIGVIKEGPGKLQRMVEAPGMARYGFGFVRRTRGWLAIPCQYETTMVLSLSAADCFRCVDLAMVCTRVDLTHAAIRPDLDAAVLARESGTPVPNKQSKVPADHARTARHAAAMLQAFSIFLPVALPRNRLPSLIASAVNSHHAGLRSSVTKLSERSVPCSQRSG